MSFTVLIPARLASTRLPDKPLADIGGKPMVVRVAEQARRSSAGQVVVACDSERIAQACDAHGVRHVMTQSGHPSGSDRLAEACDLLGLDGEQVVVNVQGDEPLIDPDLIDACAQQLTERPDCVVATAAHPIEHLDELVNPNVVKVVLDKEQRALFFSRAPIPWWRDRPTGSQQTQPEPLSAPALRHVGLYAYRAAFLRQFPKLAVSPLETIECLEQLRILWHGSRIAVHVTPSIPAAGVDTFQDLERVRGIWAQMQGV